MAPLILAIWRVRKAGFDSLAERNWRTSTPVHLKGATRRTRVATVPVSETLWS